MPSVSVVQPADPHRAQASGSRGRGSEPFPDLFEVVSNAHGARDEARHESAKRSDPAEPVSRAQARSDSLARSGGRTPAQPTRPDESDDHAIHDAAADHKPDSDSKQTDSAETTAAGQSTRPGPVVDEAGATGNGDAGAPVETVLHPDAPTNTGHAAAMPEGEIQAAGLAPISPTADGAQIAGETANRAAVVADEPVTPAAAKPEMAVDLDVVPGSAQTSVVPKEAVSVSSAPTTRQTVGTEIANAASVLSAPSTVSKPGPGAAGNQQPAPVSASVPATVDERVLALVGDAEQQLPQQNGSQVLPSKTLESGFARPTETAASPAPVPDAGTLRVPVNTAPPPISSEPVRALAASFAPVSLQAAAPNVTNPVPINGTALAVEIVRRMREGMQRFEIRLDPPELGRVDVRLDLDRNGNVTTKLTVDRQETLELMQREARGLERALQSAGLKTDTGGLEFSLRSHVDNPAAHDHSGSAGPRPDLLAMEESERADVIVEGYRTAAHARGGVDIRI